MEKTYGLRAVRLTDIPLAARMIAARVAAKECADEAEAQSVGDYPAVTGIPLDSGQA